MPGRNNPVMPARPSGRMAGAASHDTDSKPLLLRVCSAAGFAASNASISGPSRALLRSEGGAHASAWLSAAPREPAQIFAPHAMRIAAPLARSRALPFRPKMLGPSPGVRGSRPHHSRGRGIHSGYSGELLRWGPALGRPAQKRSTYREPCSGGPQDQVVLGWEVDGQAGRFI